MAGAVLEYRNKDGTGKPRTVFAHARACPHAQEKKGLENLSLALVGLKD